MWDGSPLSKSSVDQEAPVFCAGVTWSRRSSGARWIASLALNFSRSANGFCKSDGRGLSCRFPEVSQQISC